MKLKVLLDSLPWVLIDPDHPMVVDMAMLCPLDYQEVLEDVGLKAVHGWFEVFREVEVPVPEQGRTLILEGPVRVLLNRRLKLGKVRIRCHHLRDNSIEWYVRDIY